MQKNTKHDMGTTDKVALPNANMEEECNASTSRHGHMGGAGSGRPLGLAQPLLTDLSSRPAAAAPQQADKRQGRQQLFPCYRLTGRETRKAEPSASTVLCAQSQCVLCLWFWYVRPCLGGRWSRRMHACDYMFLASKVGAHRSED
jgi:hypothetical protein